MNYTNPGLVDVTARNDNLKLFHGDFQVICKKSIPDNSIDLILTDPPHDTYDTQHLCLYEALGTESFRVLKKCGSLLTYAPHNALSEIFGYMKKSGLSYWWMFAIMNSSATWMQEQKLWVGWKPILWFVKGDKPNTVNDILDVVRSQSLDKVLNIWEQPTIESDYFIQYLTAENDTVLDPIMGSDTTGISALKLRRKFIGIANSESNVLESQDRLRQAVPYKHPEHCAMTKACLVDRLKLNLATITGNITVTGTEKIHYNRKYYNQAHNLLKIGVFRPVPHFQINVSDLWPELLKELSILDNTDCSFVLKQAVGRIFEDINSKLYHNSISGILEVRLVD